MRHLWDFPPDSLANREIMAYEVSNWMELDLVPETVEAAGPLGPGAAQRYLDPDPDFDHRQWFEGSLDPRLWPVAVFDLVANNADRKLGHLLVESESGRLFAIDHGLTFHSHQKLRTVLWGFAGQPIPDPFVEAVARLREALGGKMAFRMAELLTPSDADALLRRTERLLGRPDPPPPSRRPLRPSLAPLVEDPGPRRYRMADRAENTPWRSSGVKSGSVSTASKEGMWRISSAETTAASSVRVARVISAVSDRR